jgi:hypothetical protein
MKNFELILKDRSYLVITYKKLLKGNINKVITLRDRGFSTEETYKLILKKYVVLQGIELRQFRRN